MHNVLMLDNHDGDERQVMTGQMTQKIQMLTASYVVLNLAATQCRNFTQSEKSWLIVLSVLMVHGWALKGVSEVLPHKRVPH